MQIDRVIRFVDATKRRLKHGLSDELPVFEGMGIRAEIMQVGEPALKAG